MLGILRGRAVEQEIRVGPFQGHLVYALLLWLYIVEDVFLHPWVINDHVILATPVPIREDYLASSPLPHRESAS